MDYQLLYSTQDGHLRLPFAHVGDFLRMHGINPSVAERRAIENCVQFLMSLLILAYRLRDHLNRYNQDSWVEVPFYELFLDTQSLFLFVQQFLEDTAQILRMSLPHSQRHQMPAAFRQLSKRFRDDVLPDGDALKLYLVAEARWFEEIAAVRDDICHRTAYGRMRSAVFPGLIDVLRSGGGIAPFISAPDLRSYIGDMFRRTLAFACLAEEFVYQQIAVQHPERPMNVPPAIVVKEDEIDFNQTSSEPIFQPGTMVMTLSDSSLQALDYFLDAAEKTQDGIA